MSLKTATTPQKHIHEIRALLDDPNLSKEKRAEALERLSEVDDGKTTTDEYLNELSEKLGDKHEAKENSERADHLCSCNHIKQVCDIKRGELPAEVRSSENFEHFKNKSPTERLSDYIANHPGDCKALREAHREYMDEYGDMIEVYREVETMLLRDTSR